MPRVHFEQLSAGVDDELDRDQQRFLLRRFEHDDALQEAWLRYQLMGDALRQELPLVASADFSARVMRTIDAQPIEVVRPAPARQPRGARWLKLSAGTAIAASVAAAALMVARPVDNGSAPMPRTAGLSVADAPARAPGSADSNPVTAPAVPGWLSRNNAFAYSQKASATIIGPSGSFASDSPYARSLSPYQVRPQRSATQPDGSYLLLVDPTRPSMQRSERPRGAGFSMQ